MATAAQDTHLMALTVSDVMSPGVLGCPPWAPLRMVARIMVVHEVHAVALLDAPEEPPAIVNDLGVLGTHEKVDAACAADAASWPAIVAPGDPLLAATAAMAARDQSHVLVVEPGSPVPAGVLSTLDFAAALAGRSARAVRTARPRHARPAIGPSRLDLVTAAQAMHLGVFACAPDASMRDVAAIMADRRIHCVGLLESRRQGAWQIITDRSLAREAARGGAGRAADLAGNPLWIDAHSTLDEAAAAMVANGVSHLFVGGGNDLPVGVLSILDVLDVIAAD
jgi:CBS domain-containing protein